MRTEPDRPITLAELRTDVVVLACAISAGIHGALVPQHVHEGRGAGSGFVVATAVLGVLAVVLSRSRSQVALVATTAALIGLIAAYALAITTGIPVLHPEVEAVEPLALVTKAVEAVGLVTAVTLLRRPSAPAIGQQKGTPA